MFYETIVLTLCSFTDKISIILTCVCSAGEALDLIVETKSLVPMSFSLRSNSLISFTERNLCDSTSENSQILPIELGTEVQKKRKQIMVNTGLVNVCSRVEIDYQLEGRTQGVHSSGLDSTCCMLSSSVY